MLLVLNQRSATAKYATTTKLSPRLQHCLSFTTNPATLDPGATQVGLSSLLTLPLLGRAQPPGPAGGHAAASGSGLVCWTAVQWPPCGPVLQHKPFPSCACTAPSESEKEVCVLRQDVRQQTGEVGRGHGDDQAGRQANTQAGLSGGVLSSCLTVLAWRQCVFGSLPPLQQTPQQPVLIFLFSTQLPTHQVVLLWVVVSHELCCALQHRPCIHEHVVCIVGCGQLVECQAQLRTVGVLNLLLLLVVLRMLLVGWWCVGWLVGWLCG